MDFPEVSGRPAALVTGGAGFIGSHLVDRLAEEQMKIFVLDNLSSGNKTNLCGKPLRFVYGDVRDPGLVDKLLRKSDIVFHLAEYIPGTRKYGAGHVVKYSVENPLVDFDVSCRGTLTILEKARKYERKVVFTSTAAVYGEPKTLPVTEDSPTLPFSPYGASKLCAETYLKLYWKLHEVPNTILRLFNVYGPRQEKYLMYDILLKLARNPKELEILGTGLEERDFIFVGDVVDALALAADSEEVNGEVFNVGTGRRTTVREIVELTLEILGLDPTITYTQTSWKGDIKKLVADIDKIAGVGFAPKYSLEEGLQRLMKWFNSNHP